MKPRLLVVGAGGHGLVTVDMLLKLGRYELVGVIDDEKEQGSKVLGVQVVGCMEDLVELANGVDYGLVAVGDNKVRRQLAQELTEAGIELAPWAAHPASTIGLEVKIGHHTSIMAGAIINTGSVLSDGIIVNTGAIIEHECFVGNYSHICPGVRLGGMVSVNEHCLIGTGSIVLPGVKIESGAVVGAGAVVTKDVKSESVVAGVPATVFQDRR